MPLRLLFTNNTLGRPAGTELSLHDACLAMKARGHEVAAFSTQLGEIADRLRKAGVIVLDKLKDAPWEPEVIHGQHEWETTLAAMHWPSVPVVSFCRGPYLWQEAPCRAPNVVRYVAVDEACLDRLVKQEGIPNELIEIVLNGIDLQRFHARPALPKQPVKALIFSNYATEDNFIPVVRAACEVQGISLSVIGASSGNTLSNPEHVLGEYDIVFAKGKAALESLSVGCSVIVADTAGLGPLVTIQNFNSLRRLSFGNPCMTDVFSIENVTEAIRHYSAVYGDRVAKLVRETCGLAQTVDHLEKVYLTALKSKFQPADAEVIKAFLEPLIIRITQSYKLGRKIQEAWLQARGLDDSNHLPADQADRIFSDFLRTDTKLAKAKQKIQQQRKQIEKLKERLEQAKDRSSKKGGILSSVLKKIIRRN